MPEKIFNKSEWGQLVLMGGAVTTLFVAGWVLLVASIPSHIALGSGGTFGIGTGILALTLGMRHAFDADHISAIDNATRKLMEDGQRPLTVGFFFSLGHSSVVFLLAVLLGLGIHALNTQVSEDGSELQRVTGVIGTSVSGIFLFAIAGINLAILLSIVKAWRGARGGEYDDAALEAQLENRGLLNRIFGPFARRISSPAKMYPVGLLFGLGFDTATEIALLVLSGSAVAAGMPWWAILSLPLLFAAGMSFFDAIDGTFMNVAYRWAFLHPARKIFYNLIITALSIAVAVIIGSIELLTLVGEKLGLSGGVWGWLAGVDLNAAGFAIVGLFVATWVIATVVWRMGGFEEKMTATR